MPTNRAHKQHVRASQLPGESYTAALRRLTATPDPAGSGSRWSMNGQGVGSTEFDGPFGDDDLLVVSFEGDHRRPWSGWWNAWLESDPENLIVGGRHRFGCAYPDDAAVHAVLDLVAGFVAGSLAGEQPETVSVEHGDAVSAPVNEASYFVRWDSETWAVALFEDFTDRDDPDAAVTGRLDGEELPGTWLTRSEGAGWVDEHGHPVEVYEL